MVPEYTLVIAVDEAHLPHLELVWPNWKQNRPGIFNHQPIIAVDSEDGTDILDRVQNICPEAFIARWSNPRNSYDPGDGSRWYDPQRQKMLSSILYTASSFVETPYWLKLDLDVLAKDERDDWIDPDWFIGDPAIIGHRWGYTKPAQQMMDLDKWVSLHPLELKWLHRNPPLNLIPEENSSLVSHPRIISWCAFFHTTFTQDCASSAYGTVEEPLTMPCPSQDGFMFYCAERGRKGVVRANMKKRGWVHKSKLSQVKELLEKWNG